MNRKTVFLWLLIPCLCARAADLRLGIIGADSSHAVEFTRILNGRSGPGHVSGAHIVAVYRGGSPDIEASRTRIEKFSEELRSRWQLRFVRQIDDLCPLVDGLLIESVDGRAHLEQFRQASQCRKPVFLDKPLADSLAGARQIARLAAARRIPWFSSSSMRFGKIQSLRSNDLSGAFVWGPGPTEPHQALGLSWYAIHPVEMLFTLMGPEVERVTRIHTNDADEVVGVWRGGRIGTVRAIRPGDTYGAVVFHAHSKPVIAANLPVDYTPLVQEIVDFMRTGKPAVPHAETLKIFEFMDAAQQSRRRHGASVAIPADGF